MLRPLGKQEDACQLPVSRPHMALTLWRGEQLLGELRRRAAMSQQRGPRPERAPMLPAVLLPSADRPVLSGVWQIQLVNAGSVAQVPIEPDIVAERSLRTPAPSSGALEPMSSDHIVPVEMQLTVRDERGHVFLPRHIHVQEIRFRPDELDLVRHGAPPEALAGGSIFHVLIVFDPDVETPTT